MMQADAKGTGAGKVLDVSALPSYSFGAGSLMWWGTMGMMLIEGTVFAIAVMMYFYLRGTAVEWPIDAVPPELRWGTLNTAILLVSLWPNEMAKRAAQREDRGRTRIWLSVCVVFALVFLTLRALEFTTLNVSWQASAYGSIVWLLLGLHTTHLVTDTIDTGVLAVLLFTGPFEGKRFVDVCENAMYWYFVVGSWLPIYAVIYLAPRG
ncbi:MULTISPECIES: cytochrome c oxidase subunit 3 [unclassified Variovorax]|uniref:cytochrome c oxidase subunit 3 n=1 Tax=unclassified Variovorax TaxID=663243 RepID=UPI0008B66D86|nr:MULTISPECIES: cytochrome c oxidase subunit 3 [unclassified Variovorax]SEK17123.1 Heme/copper-type cytochrome/quinol oxidase, subunit 3 [Variovorax sp. OK202]SFE72874.1 cytochrome c oxidase subunit I+III [Variovorax sp. OK212]